MFLQTNFRKGTGILLVKGTSHTGMKETCVKTMMITSASSEVGRLKKSLRKKMMDKWTIRPLSVSKSIDVFYLLGGYRWVDKHWNRIARGPERYRTRAFESLQGFHCEFKCTEQCLVDCIRETM